MQTLLLLFKNVYSLGYYRMMWLRPIVLKLWLWNSNFFKKCVNTVKVLLKFFYLTRVWGIVNLVPLFLVRSSYQYPTAGDFSAESLRVEYPMLYFDDPILGPMEWYGTKVIPFREPANQMDDLLVTLMSDTEYSAYTTLGPLFNYWSHLPELCFIIWLVYLYWFGQPARIIIYINRTISMLLGWSVVLAGMLGMWYTPVNFLFGEYLMISNTYTLMVKLIMIVLFIIFLILIEATKVLEEDPARYLSALQLVIALILFSFFIAHAHNLFLVFLLLEGISFIVTMMFATSFSPNAYIRPAMQYYCLNFASSAFLLACLFFTYLVFGSFDIDGISTSLKNNPQLAGTAEGIIIISCFIASFAVKFGIFPFSLWMAPIYSESSYDLILLYGVILKGLAFFVAYPFLTIAFNGLSKLWIVLFVVWGTASVFVGTIGSYLQMSIKEFLAHTSVSHFGHIAVLLGCSANYLSFTAAFLYLFAYMAASVGFIGILMNTYYDDRDLDKPLKEAPYEIVQGSAEYYDSDPVIVLNKRGLRRLHVFSELSALRRDQPAAAVALTVFILTFAGVPPTLGFFVKFTFYKYVLLQSPGLALFFLIVQACSLYAYFVPIAIMWFEDNPGAINYSIAISASREITLFGAFMVFLTGISALFFYSPLLLLCLIFTLRGSVSYYTPYVGSEDGPIDNITNSVFWDSLGLPPWPRFPAWHKYDVVVNVGTSDLISIFHPYAASIIAFLLLGALLARFDWSFRDKTVLEVPSYKIVVDLSPKGENRFRE